MGLLKKHRATGEATLEAPILVDGETGLANSTALGRALRHEIARSRRYGRKASLALFEVQIVATRSSGVPPPSPARFIAQALTAAARESDIVARVDETLFAVFLVEYDDARSEIFTERVRTALCSEPYARSSDGSGLYLRAWAGATDWDSSIEDPAAYLRAAYDDLVNTSAGPESASKLFAEARPR
jgi:GGDEF domain-containing protein